MDRRYSRSEKGKWQAPPELPAKRLPVRIPANDCDDLIAANRLTIIGRLTNTQIQKPRVVIDFMAQESECPHRPLHAPPPKDRVLGITQSIALQRIEAEKRRHDERRGYRRPEDSHPVSRFHAISSLQSDRNRASEGKPYSRVGEHQRDQSISSRPARSRSDYHRYGAPSLQYRVVEKSKFSSGSSAPHQHSGNRAEGLVNTGSIPKPLPEVEQNMESQRVCTPTRNLTDRLGAPLGEAGSHGPEPRKEITSARNLQSRIEIPSGTKENAHSGSGGKRSALERLAEPSLRKAPSFESGRLQTRESLADEVHQSKQREEETRVQEPVRVSATLRLQDNNEGTSRRASRSIPVDPQSKPATKRKVSSRRRVLRSPLQTLAQRKPSTGRPTTSTRRKLVVDKDPNLPCDKAGTSKSRKKTGPSSTSLHYTHYFSIPPEGLSGGLSLFWNDDTDITILESSPNLVDTEIVHKGVTSFVSFVYGPPATENRAEYWRKLHSMGQNRVSPDPLTTYLYPGNRGPLSFVQ
ncbi:hypothetical protein Bca52824_030347 [Brassica carinata]|uniref:Uncharacterized protein n=1 Tax=Brassica carinata TaxID=52824 RepID=A0A8X7V5H9_BRACI|nr:hypothetical protein Bca52824_030347 [Brassica carinata]